ncbi:MAG TPA: hypothetical protein VFI58_11285 [Xanthobacteraceae bacterium]|jgi:hypothetical protein|nr:hypothetical protein [Xanthobacteraceae bacterium]
MSNKKSEPNAAKRELSPQERTAIGKFLARSAANTAPRLKVLNEKQGVRISPDHPNQSAGQMLLMDALGTADPDFYQGILHQLVSAGSQGAQIDERALNFMLSVVKGVQPRDQIEAMLAAQMASVHTASMKMAQRLGQVENIPQQDSAERAFNKLTRTFVSQMEALKRYRTGGEQKVTVQHVSVSEGGQAIVGNVTQTQRETARAKAANSPPALPNAQEPPMPILGERATAPVPLKRKPANDR